MEFRTRSTEDGIRLFMAEVQGGRELYDEPGSHEVVGSSISRSKGHRRPRLSLVKIAVRCRRSLGRRIDGLVVLERPFTIVVGSQEV